MNKKKFIVLIGSIGGLILLATLTIVLVLCLKPKGSKTYRSVKAYNMEGTVNVKRKGKEVKAYDDMNFLIDDSIHVLKNSSLTLRLDEDKFIYVYENTSLELRPAGKKNKTKTQIHINEGGVVVDVKEKLKDGETFDISSSNSVMSIRGTQVAVKVSKGSDYVTTTQTVISGLTDTYFVSAVGGKLQANTSKEKAGEVLVASTKIKNTLSYDEMQSFVKKGKEASAYDSADDMSKAVSGIDLRDVTADEFNEYKYVIDNYMTVSNSNEWTKPLTINSILVGDELAPLAEAKYGTINYKYSTDNIDFDDAIPTNPGKYYVKAIANNNGELFESEARIFSIFDKPLESLDVKYGTYLSDYSNLLTPGWEFSLDNDGFVDQSSGSGEINIYNPFIDLFSKLTLNYNKGIRKATYNGESLKFASSHSDCYDIGDTSDNIFDYVLAEEYNRAWLLERIDITDFDSYLGGVDFSIIFSNDYMSDPTDVTVIPDYLSEDNHEYFMYLIINETENYELYNAQFSFNTVSSNLFGQLDITSEEVLGDHGFELDDSGNMAITYTPGMKITKSDFNYLFDYVSGIELDRGSFELSPIYGAGDDESYELSSIDGCKYYYYAIMLNYLPEMSLGVSHEGDSELYPVIELQFVVSPAKITTSFNQTGHKAFTDNGWVLDTTNPNIVTYTISFNNYEGHEDENHFTFEELISYIDVPSDLEIDVENSVLNNTSDAPIFEVDAIDQVGDFTLTVAYKDNDNYEIVTDMIIFKIELAP